MFNFYGHVLLANSILVNYKVVAAQVWQEISIWIFDVEFDRDLACHRLELDFRLLRSLLSFEEGSRWPGRYRHLGPLLFLRRCPCLLAKRLPPPGEGGSREQQGTCKAELCHSPHGHLLSSQGRALRSSRDPAGTYTLVAATSSPFVTSVRTRTLCRPGFFS